MTTHLALFASLLVTGLAALQAGVAFAQLNRSTPVITGVSPREPQPMPTPQRLTIDGREFQPRLEFTVTSPEGGTARFKENAIVGRTDAMFQVDVPLITRGRYTLVVTNPDGGVSPAFVLDVGKTPASTGPVIEKVLPEQLTKQPEPQPLRLQGQRFAMGLRAVVTDPTGTDVTGPTVSNVTPTTVTVTVKLETVGTYNLVVINPTGAASNVMNLVVR
jgi:hypothetical protein